MPGIDCGARRLFRHSLLPAVTALLVAMPLSAADRPATAVIASTADTTRWSRPLEALGTVRADEAVTLSATVTEVVRSIGFEDGQSVEAGALLVHLEDAEEQAELAAAQARLVEERNGLERARRLEERNLGVRADVEDSRARVQQITAEIEAIQARLAAHRLRAPFDGVAGFRDISVGALVTPGTELVTIDKLDRVKVDFTLPARHLGQVSAGQRVTARTQAWPKAVFDGTVRAIRPRVNAETRSLGVRAVFDNADGRLRPGMLMRTVLEQDGREVVVVPESVLLPRGDHQYLFVIDEASNRVERREVEIGERRPGKVEVTAGLDGGELLVRHGVQKIRDGDLVRILGVADEQTSVREILEEHRDEAMNGQGGG